MIVLQKAVAILVILFLMMRPPWPCPINLCQQTVRLGYVTRDAWRLINTNIFPEKRKSHMQRKRLLKSASKYSSEYMERDGGATSAQRWSCLALAVGKVRFCPGRRCSLSIVTRDKNERASLLFFCDRLHVMRPPDTLDSRGCLPPVAAHAG